MDRETITDLLIEHGELHIVVEEHEHVTGGSDDYIGIRDCVDDHYELRDEYIVVNEGNTKHYIPYDRIVYAQKPVSFPD